MFQMGWKHRLVLFFSEIAISAMEEMQNFLLKAIQDELSW